MTQQIVLFPNVEIMGNLSKEQSIKYLKRYCTVDDLGDTIYVKKLGCNKTTFAIDYTFDKISAIRKIKDIQGNNTDEILFERNSGDDIDESRCRCDKPCLDETESQCVICGGELD